MAYGRWAHRVTDADSYTQALNAYWQSPAMGKDALSKNGLVVVIGSSDRVHATWVRAFTGMPVGNEALLQDITSNLTGKRLDPATLLGAPTVANPGSPKPVFVNSSGLLNQTLWGPDKFQRVCMTCKSAGDSGIGYTYLQSQIEPHGGAKVAIVAITALVTAAAWAGVWVLAYALTESGYDLAVPTLTSNRARRRTAASRRKFRRAA